MDYGLQSLLVKLDKDSEEQLQTKTYDHTRPRGAELREVGNEIDALAADLTALENEIEVASSPRKGLH